MLLSAFQINWCKPNNNYISTFTIITIIWPLHKGFFEFCENILKSHFFAANIGKFAQHINAKMGELKKKKKGKKKNVKKKKKKCKNVRHRNCKRWQL
jgi:hypothetical protein